MTIEVGEDLFADLDAKDASPEAIERKLGRALAISQKLNAKLTNVKNQIPPGPPTFPQRDLLLQIRTEANNAIATVNIMLGNDA